MLGGGFQNIFKIPELKKRIFYTFALLSVYRIGRTQTFATPSSAGRAGSSKPRATTTSVEEFGMERPAFDAKFPSSARGTQGTPATRLTAMFDGPAPGVAAGFGSQRLSTATHGGRR